MIPQEIDVTPTSKQVREFLDRILHDDRVATDVFWPCRSGKQPGEALDDVRSDFIKSRCGGAMHKYSIPFRSPYEWQVARTKEALTDNPMWYDFAAMDNESKTRVLVMLPASFADELYPITGRVTLRHFESNDDLCEILNERARAAGLPRCFSGEMSKAELVGMCNDRGARKGRPSRLLWMPRYGWQYVQSCCRRVRAPRFRVV